MLREAFPVGIDALDPTGAVESIWQRRMVEIDLSRGLAARLDALEAPGETLLVVDFIDERFHLYELKGSLATGSVELRRTRIDDLPDVTKIRSGTDEHFALWQTGFRRFVAHARSLGMEPIVNRVRWARRSADGTAFRETAESIAAADAHLERLYRAADALGVPSIDYGGTGFVATSSHKWGLAPFHYTEEVYARFLDQLGRIAAVARPAPADERMAGT